MLRPVAPKKVAAGNSPWGSAAARPAGGILRPVAGSAIGGVHTSASIMAQKEQEMKKRQEELKEKRAAEELKRQQHSAAFAVRRVIQRLRVCEPANFAELVAELEKCQEENLEAMGELAEAVRGESEKALALAEEKFKAEEEKRLAKEKAEEEKAKKVEEDINKLQSFVDEASEQVEDCEAKATAAAEANAIISEVTAEKDADPGDLLAAVENAEKQTEDAKEAFKAAAESMKEKRSEVIKMKSAGIAQQTMECTKMLGELQKKLAASQKDLTGLKEIAAAAKQQAAKRGAVLKKEQDRKVAFTMHDKDKDGKLNKKEVIAFAKNQYGFELDAALVQKILSKIPSGTSGVTFERFTKLRAHISMQKSLAKARKERAEAEEAERLKKEQEEILKAEQDAAIVGIKEALAEVTEKAAKTDEFVTAAKEAAKKLTPGLSSSDAEAACDEVDTQVKEGRELLKSVEEWVKQNEGEEGEDKVVKAFRTKELSKLQEKVKGQKLALNKVATQVQEARDACTRKRCAEMEAKRMELAPCVAALAKAESKTGQEIFKAASSGGEMATKEFSAFIKSLSGRIEPDLLPEIFRPDTLEDTLAESLFHHVACGAESIDEEKFVAMMQIHYRVTKATVLTSEQSINSKSVRKLDLGEVVELLEGPITEESVGLKRFRGKAAQDGKEGWVTIAGSKGSLMLEPVPTYFTCVKETNLAVGMKVTEKDIRKIAKGENVQMLEAEQKDTSCGVLRMKVRMLKDDKVGWVTTTGNKNGVVFFEPC